MKNSEVIRRVRQIAGDLAVLQFTDAILADWINDGVRECVIENNLLQKTASSNTVIGTSTYTLPVDILKLYSVQVNNEKLRVLNYSEFEQMGAGAPAGNQTNGAPNIAYVWAGVLNLFPPPDTVVSLKINYISEPVDWDGTNPTNTTPPIPSSYHLRVVTYCLAQVALQDEDVNKYNQFMTMFQSGVINLSNQINQEEDIYPSMAVSARDMGEWPGTLEW